MPTQVNMHEAKSQLSRLVDQAAAGEEVIIARAGKPAVRLVPYVAPDAEPRKPGGWEGRVRMSEDFDKLPEAVLAAFRGERP